MSTCFLSDLHLFSLRSRAWAFMPLIVGRLGTVDTVILGGDVFDFKWSTLGSDLATAEEAASWLEALMERFPAVKFVLLLGNHDDHPTLVKRLETLAAARTNFEWERYCLRIGNAVFLHGDAANPFFNQARLEASRCTIHRHRRKGRVMNAIYGGTVRLRLHVLGARLVFPRRLVVRRILRYLREMGHGPESGVRNVYFGHTHLAMQAYPHRGVHFHNGGAPIEGLGFQVLVVDLD